MMQVIKRPEGEKASVRTYHGSYCQRILIAVFMIMGIFEMWSHLTETMAAKDAEIEALKAKIMMLTEEKARLKEIVDEVEEAGAAIRAVNPHAPEEEVRIMAVRQVAMARKYGIPLDLIIYRDWAEADLRWLPADRRGPCGEVSTAQVWRPTFRQLRPYGDYLDVDEVYDAGTEYLAGCYRTALKWLGETADKVQIYRLSLAFYNAGMGHRPEVALHKAQAHVRRVEGIFAKAEKLGVA